MNSLTKTILNILVIVLIFECHSCVCSEEQSGQQSGQYDDFRCKCVCPSPGVVTNDTVASKRKLYIGNVSPNRCNCDYVVLPQLSHDIQDKAKEFCPRCECKYESRNTSTIRFVIIFIIGIISFLVVYMAFLMLLDPLIHKCMH